MKHTKLKLSMIAFSLAALVGCNESSNQSKANTTVTQKATVSSANTQTKTEFRYDWLSGVKVTGTVEESERQDKNFYFVIDGSGSMDASSCEGDGNKIDIAKRAVVDYSKTLGDSNIGLVVFDSNGINERFSLSKINHSEFRNQVNSIVAGSGTPLESSIKIAYDKLKSQASMQGSNGEYNLVIVTDGEANSGEDPTSIVNEIGYKSPVNITTIGFCIGDRHSLNNKELVHYYAASDYTSILAGLKEVQSEGENISDEEFVSLLDSL
ncbi:MAG: hypothetical protein CL760_11275 [Chloroflexi bacterium]|nr:hypothetical protein [Chloroflexota bacterium]|tara:strand:+ start:39134 stop:39934 length:801 start_codon:yes stop_codon:yes gene_type:complete